MTTLGIVMVVLLAAVSLGLSCVEAAFYLLKRRALPYLSPQNPRADVANAYLADPPTLLMPVHMGTYTAHVTMTILVTSMLLDTLEHWALLTALLVMLVYLFAVRLTVPYAVVRNAPERSLLVALPVFAPYARALAPLVSLLRQTSDGGSGGLGDATSGVVEVPAAPVDASDERRLAESLLRFSDTQVREIMTPRPDIVAVQADASVAELRALLRESLYSRIPVYGDNLDDIVGLVTVRDLMNYDGDPKAPLRPLARPARLVPESKRISLLLRELQASGNSVAVVIDEYGGTAGLVSVEDIVEELVGEIKDEYDSEVEPIEREPDGAVLVTGRVTLDRLEEALETSLPESEEVDTVGGLVATAFGRIPRVGETLDFHTFRIEVVEAERKRVNRVRFRRRPEPAAGPAG